MVKKLAKYLKGLGWLMIVSAGGMIIEAICELLMPSLANTIYETVSTTSTPDETRSFVIKYGILMLVLAVIGLSGGLATMKSSAVVSQRFAYRLRNDVFKKNKQIFI
ncbi:MAG: hypothetical protein LIO62_01025 [Clostridiales bacterium]|nr:hypothetical protein [Clostridiales bacterium]